MAKDAKKILIMTASGAYNLGDELILKEEYEFMTKHYPGSDITVFTYDPSSMLLDRQNVKSEIYFPNHFFAKPFKNLWYAIKNSIKIIKADVLIVGGGGILFDNEIGVSFTKVLYQWFLRIKLARISGTTILFWGISIEVEQMQNKLKLKKIFKPGDYILVRDARSKGLLDAFEIPAVRVDDIVFHYTPPKIEKKSEKKRVGISLRGGFLGESEQYIPQIYEFLQNEGYEPVFLVHTTSGSESQNDTITIKRIMAGKTYNISKTIAQTLSLYPTLYAVVGMRFHATVLACVHEIPCIPIAYGPKNAELVKDLEIEHLSLEPHSLNFEIFQNMWHTLVNDYEKEQQHMARKHTEIRKRLITTLETL